MQQRLKKMLRLVLGFTLLCMDTLKLLDNLGEFFLQ
jgi:hypothetical protein